MICPVCGKGELEMDHIWHGQDVSISHLACVEKMQDGAKRLVASNERLLKRAEKAEAENVRLREAVEAEVLWHDSEDDHKTTTFDERMDLCHYSEWLAKRAIGRDVTDEYEGIPRLVLNLRDRAEEGGE